MHRRVFFPFASLFFVGCAVGGQSESQAFQNPPSCAALVETHRANPSLGPEQPPVPRAIQIPSGIEGEIVASFVVMESGRVDPESIELQSESPITDRAGIERALNTWSFTPGRQGECWVPSLYRYTFRLG